MHATLAATHARSAEFVAPWVLVACHKCMALDIADIAIGLVIWPIYTMGTAFAPCDLGCMQYSWIIYPHPYLDGWLYRWAMTAMVVTPPGHFA